MTDRDDRIKLPLIRTEFLNSEEISDSEQYLGIIKQILKRILPREFFDQYQQPPYSQEELISYFRSLLPLITSTPCMKTPSNMSFFVLSKFRRGAFKFFFEMLSRWLVPGKRLNVLLMYAVDFSMPELSEELYNVCEVVIRIENQEELEEIQRNFPIIESELSLGIDSRYHARRILEIKGLSNDEKTAMIQEYIAHLTSRLPNAFSYDVYTEMQHLLVMCRNEFKSLREVEHLSRIICVQYLFRKSIRDAIKENSGKRHLLLKIFKGNIRKSEGNQHVLCLIVAVNFLRDQEIFEERHLLGAVRNYLPSAIPVQNSFLYHRRGSEPVGTLYLEIQKDCGEDFTSDEIRQLRQKLPSDLEGRVEQLTHPVFMPRNEEEIMRNILTLGDQLKYLRDIPQMFVTFDEQTHHDIFFTVTIVRILRPESLSIQEMFLEADSFLEYIHDRCKTIGFLRKKYEKEATVFRIKVAKDQFLRRDHSIDLYKARQTVVSEISRVVGDIRDYNGGMISKQNELLTQVREQLQQGDQFNELLFENFFYSLNPVIMRTVLEPEALKKLYLMMTEAIADGFYNEESYAMNIRAEPNSIFVMIGVEDKVVEEEIKRALKQLKLPSASLATSSVRVYDVPYLGFIYRCEDPQKQRKFCITIQHAAEKCKNYKI